MQAVAGLAISTLIIASLVVSVRLMVLHRRTGELPELLLGLMLFLSVGMGYPLMIAAPHLEGSVLRVVIALFGERPNMPGEVNVFGLGRISFVIVTYAWTAWESLHQRAMMARRLRLGMADPVVCNRFLL
jgi:hypothetical protein